MNQYVITVKSEPKSMLDNGIEKFRVNAWNEDQAKSIIIKSSQFPKGGNIVKIREAKYTKKYDK